MLCPRCRIMTKPVQQQGIMESSCPQCQGIWIGSLALKRLENRQLDPQVAPAEQNGDSLAALADEVTQTNTATPLECPFCHQPMIKERVHPMIPVQADHCGKCDYIWLDRGEQELLLRLYRELMTSNDPELAARRDKYQQLTTMTAAMQSAAYQDPSPAVGGAGTAGIIAAQVGMDIVRDLASNSAATSIVCDIAESVLGAFLR